MKITALAGGSGSIKLLRGLTKVPSLDVSIISNVGDNIWLHGLYICPDIDIIAYGLAGILDKKQGWGIQDDTFNFMKQTTSYRTDTWFTLGDRDLATHVFRTQLLGQGLDLTEITKHLSKRLGIKYEILPSTNGSLQTLVRTAKGEMHFQEFWVKGKGRGVVRDVVYSGAKTTNPTPEAIQAIESSDIILILPANPITSIGPILSIPSLRKKIRERRSRCVAVSPIIGREPISGPAKKLMRGLGIEVSVVGVAKLYSDVISKIFIDKKDMRHSDRIRDNNVETHLAKILMKSDEDEKNLAMEILERIQL